MRWAVSAVGEQQKRVRLHADYYVGAHRLMIQEKRLEQVFGKLFADFRLNLCGAVVDALADRLQISSFSAGDSESADAQDVWKKNRMRRRAGQVHQAAIASGDSHCLVWPDRMGNPIIYPQKPTEVCVEYDPESPGKIVRAAKLWKERDGVHYLTLYYPDRVEKYQTKTKIEGLKGGSTAPANFQPRRVEGERWPLPNRYERVPIFHFGNASDLGEVGVSELRDAIPVQDGLNKSVFDMLVAGEFMAYPQRYAMNIEVKTRKNPLTGEDEPINPFRAGPERVWIANSGGGEQPQIGQLAAADIEKMLKVKQGWSLDMAQVTMTPPHYFMLPSGLVSGESQKTAEQKLDSKVTDRQIAFGDTWADLMAFAVRILRGRASDGLELDTNWKDTKPRNQIEEWQIVRQKLDAGVSNDQVLREQGYEQDQIKQFREENAKGGLGQAPAARVPQVPDLSFGES